MLLEAAQQLSTARRILQGDTDVYQIAHVNHPCSVWVRQTQENYDWLFRHYYALCREYTYRYLRIHKSFHLFDRLKRPLSGFPESGLQPFALAMPEKYKQIDPVEAYRAYYLGEKIHGGMWTNRARVHLDDWLRLRVSRDQFKPFEPKSKHDRTSGLQAGVQTGRSVLLQSEVL